MKLAKSSSATSQLVVDALYFKILLLTTPVTSTSVNAPIVVVRLSVDASKRAFDVFQASTCPVAGANEGSTSVSLAIEIGGLTAIPPLVAPSPMCRFHR